MIERRWLVLLVNASLLALPGSSASETYRWMDAHGTVTYADRPPQPAEVAARPPAPTVEARPAPPVEAARTGPATVEELLELSGLKAQLVGLASRLTGELRPAQGQMSPEDGAAVDRILRQAIRHEKLYALVRDELRRDLDRAKLETAVAWLRSPVARKITALEVEASQPGTDQRRAAYAAGLKADPPSPRRVELLQRLDWVSGTTEASADVAMTITRSVSRAVAAVSPPEQRLRPGQIENRVAELRARVSASLGQAQLVSMLFTYQSLADEELDAYLRFCSSDAGRWYNARMHKALVSAVDGVVGPTAAELVRAVPPARWTRAPN